MLRFPARGTGCPFGTRRATSSRRGSERLEGLWTDVSAGGAWGWTCRVKEFKVIKDFKVFRVVKVLKTLRSLRTLMTLGSLRSLKTLKTLMLLGHRQDGGCHSQLRTRGSASLPLWGMRVNWWFATANAGSGCGNARGGWR